MYPKEAALFASSTLEKECQFDLTHLQEDICCKFLVGKPFIQNPDELRTQFKFTASRVEALELGISQGDLDILKQYLEEKFQCMKVLRVLSVVFFSPVMLILCVVFSICSFPYKENKFKNLSMDFIQQIANF